MQEGSLAHTDRTRCEEIILTIPQKGRAHELADWLEGIQRHSRQGDDSPLYLILGRPAWAKRVLSGNTSNPLGRKPIPRNEVVPHE